MQKPSQSLDNERNAKSSKWKQNLYEKYLKKRTTKSTELEIIERTSKKVTTLRSYYDLNKLLSYKD